MTEKADLETAVTETTEVVELSALEVEFEKINTTIKTLEEEEQTLLTKWVKDWNNFLTFKKRFDPKKNITYRAGYIAKVNFGQNIGSEQSGRRPAVIIEDNNRSSPVVTVIPLSSLKEEVSVEEVESKGNVYLGELKAYNDVFNQGKGTESIALLSQIRAISKMRISFPMKSKDEVIKLDPLLLKKVYQAIGDRYTTAGLIEEEKGNELSTGE